MPFSFYPYCHFSDSRISSEDSDFLSAVFCLHYIYPFRKRTILMCHIPPIKVIDTEFLTTMDFAANHRYAAF